MVMRVMRTTSVMNVMKPKIDHAWFRSASPRTDGGAAVAIVELCANEATVFQLGLPALAQGELKRCSLLELDDGLVARISENVWLLMPHGGPLVLRLVAAKLLLAGIVEQNGPACGTFPEASSEIELRMLSALADARSPRAISLLLRQPKLWAAVGAVNDPTRDSILNRLLVPPRIVVLGGANIGKSSLANALARRDVALVADIPGTTRDHVGVWLDLDGLVVRWIDTPGLRETSDEIEIAARTQALALVETATMVLLCGDTTHPPPPPPAGVAAERIKVVQLRVDLGTVEWHADWAVSVRSASSLSSLATGVREALVPREVINNSLAWKFWT